jgi:Protein of unknown function (DUF3617)
MSRSLAMPLAAVVLLAGCGSEKSADKPAELAKAAAITPSEQPQPGKYRATMKVLEVNIPGLPAGQAAKMKNMFGAAGRSFEFCMTAQEAAEGYREFGKRAAEGKCTYENFSAADGKIAGTSTCQTGEGMTARIEMAGTYSPTGSTMKITTRTETPGVPGGAMTMQAEMTQERLGDC